MSPSHLTQTGLLDLVLEAGVVAKIVLLVLFSSSVFCWAIILTKWRAFKSALRQNKKFSDIFWSSKSIEEILGKTERFPRAPVVSVFKSGIKELKKHSESGGAGSNQEKLDHIYRALVRTSSDELALLERNISWLATTASAAPFVGLFGTVWGIINSFQSIGATGNANLAVVAPGISEALITTAAGIAAAIPAVVAYNYFVGQARRVAADMDSFAFDFISILSRTSKKG